METTYFTFDEWARIRGLLGVTPGQKITASMLCQKLTAATGKANALLPQSLSLSLSATPARDPLAASLGDKPLNLAQCRRLSPLEVDAMARRRAAGEDDEDEDEDATIAASFAPSANPLLADATRRQRQAALATR